MKIPPNVYSGYRYPDEIISHADWLYPFSALRLVYSANPAHIGAVIPASYQEALSAQKILLLGFILGA